MEKVIPLEPGRFYHIYNRGINGTSLFPRPQLYRSFLNDYAYFTEPLFDTYAYCLLNNHFHILVRIKEPHEVDSQRWRTERGWTKLSEPSRLLGHAFNSHAQTVNALTGRTGGLFEGPFHREWVDRDTYFSQLVFYIHSNPLKHGFVSDFTTYPHSSYQSHLSTKPTLLKRQFVLDWFGGHQSYIDFHTGMTREAFSDFLDEKM
ncbi:hypothetical protein [Spirosoma sp. 209]|uniref:hypothetical protein n=1 Tax=Spirosoma sp. 209 TaxID=1955701 RepID=UPI00111745B1|nr:hypothetical protein [Spirosoma sp. 209]